MLVLGLTGFERRGFGRPFLDMPGGDGGGDGVDVVDRNVGPGPSPGSGDSIGAKWSRGLVLSFSADCETGRDMARLGCG